jgi:hypothetical protein
MRDLFDTLAALEIEFRGGFINGDTLAKPGRADNDETAAALDTLAAAETIEPETEPENE